MTHSISPRVYKLLKNITLEDVKPGNMADVGNPISIEELNREELYRLVLVNFARLSAQSEWEGLLG